MGATAIILAAGKGTRMESELPKVLHEVCGRPMLAYVLDACREAGCERMLVVIGYRADLVREAFACAGGDVTWVEQRKQLGTGHAVMVCRDYLRSMEGAVLVVAGDGPLLRSATLGELLRVHGETGAACTLATSILPDPARYGRIIRDDGGEVQGIVEFLDADERQRGVREVNVSLYCFDAPALCAVLDDLDNDNAKGEYYLTDAVALLKAAGRRLAAVPAVPPQDVLSVNTDKELEQVSELMAARSADRGDNDDG
jgi:UDP-N-acetylglucosamine diphosphorylase/glucosamine-1-phosphate N-acetyltransferase